jgi:hypothetical protein
MKTCCHRQKEQQGDGQDGEHVLPRGTDREEGPRAETGIRPLAGILEDGDDTVLAGDERSSKWSGNDTGPSRRTKN